MSTSDPGNQQYLPPNQPQQPRYSAPGSAPGTPPPGYAAPAYGAPGYGVPGPGEPYDGALHPDDLSRPLYGASFGQAVKRFFKQYGNFTGRASRSEFWWSQLFVFLIELIPVILTVIGGVSAAVWAAMRAESEAGAGRTAGSLFMLAPLIVLLVLGGILGAVVGLALIVPQLSLYWRRLHDANLAGPFWFLTFTSIGGIIVFVFTLLGPKPEGRRFVSSRASR